MPKKFSSSTIRPKNTSGRGKRHTVRRTNASTGRMNRSKNSNTDNRGGRGSSSNTGGSSSALSSRTRKAIDNLPSHAQKTYREAHKNAVKQYSNPSKRRGGKQQSKEQIAHKVAWSAVKKEYRKKGEKWEQITD